MLTVTNDAATAMRSALEHADLPPSTGLRISADRSETEENSKPALRLDVATEGEAEDEIVTAPGGPQVFIEPGVVPFVQDKVLDGELEPSGRAAFRIVTQT